jgi:hypothetical protein
MAETTKHFLEKLLYFALIDLRFEGHTTHDELVFWLADLFHSVPLQLDRVERGELSPDDVMRWLRTRASGTLMEAWLNLRMEQLTKEMRREAAPDGNARAYRASYVAPFRLPGASVCRTMEIAVPGRYVPL